ncbi:hypothetical protein SFRURICE_000973 [Spodoptera frugiperda]|nr:hypothetical protein SFRURICE_000973 [Spodoptera frugiperda]
MFGVAGGDTSAADPRGGPAEPAPGACRWWQTGHRTRRRASRDRGNELGALWCEPTATEQRAVVFRVAQGPFIEEFHQCVTHGFYTERWQEQAYTTLSLIFMFILPLVILVSTYVSTSEKVFKPEVRRQEKYFTPDMNRRRLIDRAKMKSLRMSVVIVAAFLIWWTPYYVMMIIFTFLNPDKDQSEELLSGIFFFGMSNSLVNPVIYGAFHLWPKKNRSHRHSDRESGGHHASLLRRGDNNTSSIRLTMNNRSMRSSAKYSNGHNVSLL